MSFEYSLPWFLELCIAFFEAPLLIIYLFNCTGSQLQHSVSSAFIVACKLLVAACEIQFFDQDQPRPPALAAQNAREVPVYCFLNLYN